VYCAIDGGAYTCWIEAATNHSAQYQGSYGHTYAFYSIARDAVGNIELPPAVADTTTQVTLLAPAGVSATDGLYADSIGVSWNTVPSATMYAVYRSISAQFAGEALLGTTTASEYQDATVVPGTTYYYRVGARVSAYESVRSVSDSGFALMTAAWTGEWKYKDAKTTDVLIGKKLPYDLKGYFLDKWQIGMASIVDGKITNFYGPHMMEGKGKKLSKWQYKAKKDASIVFISKDKPDKNKLVYKLWHQMPETIVIYLVPPGVNITTRNQMTIDNLRFILVPVDPAQSNGWQELTPTIINEEQ